MSYHLPLLFQVLRPKLDLSIRFCPCPMVRSIHEMSPHNMDIYQLKITLMDENLQMPQPKES